MQKVLTAEQMREVDRLTTERYGIPSIILMENAAHAVARVITEKLGGSVDGRNISILCGKGNNGGDGAAAARILWTAGADVEVYLFGKVEETRGDARLNFDAVKKLNERDPPFSPYLFLHEVESLDAEAEQILLKSHVIVDAIFGTGLTRPVDGDINMLFRKIDAKRDKLGRSPLLVSIDLPSGLNADSATEFRSAFNADVTVTFTAPKPANVLAPNFRKNGELVVAQIGTPYELLDETVSNLEVSDQLDVSWGWCRISKFSDDSYKNKRGHAIVIAGSESYSGAAVLVGDAAMRSGVGLVTIATPRSSKDSIAARVLPEVMVKGVSETESGAVAEEAFEELHDLLEKADAVAIGSGLSQDESTRRFVQKVIENRKCPTIVDADALNLISPFHGPQSEGPPKGGTQSLIFTPHEGEFMRLLGATDKEAIKDRVAAVRNFCREQNVILVLKGERVLIGEPGGKVVVNPTGNSGLGKAGNGDTLTGILSGFVAQASAMDIEIFETVVAAVYVAGMAGDVAEKKYGKRVMTSSDVRECLTEVFYELETEKK